MANTTNLHEESKDVWSGCVPVSEEDGFGWRLIGDGESRGTTRVHS